MDAALVKDKYYTQPNEATEDNKQSKNSSLEESEPQYHFQGHSARSQHKRFAWYAIHAMLQVGSQRRPKIDVQQG